MTADDILAASASPAELERLYRADRQQFTAAFPAAWAREPSSVVLGLIAAGMFGARWQWKSRRRPAKS